VQNGKKTGSLIDAEAALKRAKVEVAFLVGAPHRERWFPGFTYKYDDAAGDYVGIPGESKSQPQPKKVDEEKDAPTQTQLQLDNLKTELKSQQEAKAVLDEQLTELRQNLFDSSGDIEVGNQTATRRERGKEVGKDTTEVF
jgi:hypothetical protein